MEAAQAGQDRPCTSKKLDARARIPTARREEQHGGNRLQLALPQMQPLKKTCTLIPQCIHDCLALCTEEEAIRST